jgi:membrane protease YdiL (CAAX protease family)
MEHEPSVLPTPPESPSFLERYNISPVLFGFLALLVVFVLYQIVGGVLSLLIFGLKPTQDTVFGFRLATGAGQILFLLLPTLVLARISSREPSRFMRLRAPAPRALGAGLVGIFSLQQMLQIYMVFQEKIPLPGPVHSTMEEFKTLFDELYRMLVGSSSLPELAWVTLVVAVIPAVVEELLFRGLIQHHFENGLTPLRGMLLTGVVFGAYHLNPFSFVPLAVLGVYLGFLTLRSGSVWVSIGAHFVNNFFACVTFYLHLSDDYVVTGDAAVMSTSALLATFWFFGVLFLISNLYFIKITAPVHAKIGEPPPGHE